jgi:ABC-2 type transport system permease protein
LTSGAIRGLWSRDFLIARSYRLAVLLDLVLGLLNLLVYFFISRTFEGTVPADLGPAPSYFAYAGVGIAMTTVINAATVAVATRIREEQLTGTLEAMITQPISSMSLAAGMSGLPFLTAVVRAAVYLGLGTLLLDLTFPDADWPGAAAVLAMSGIALSSLGVASAAMVMIVKRGDIVVSLAVFALGIFSGALFPIAVLPNWLEPIAEVMPTTLAFDGLRAALFGGAGWSDEVLGLGLYAIGLLPLSLWAFAAAIRVAKRSGSVAEY